MTTKKATKKTPRKRAKKATKKTASQRKGRPKGAKNVQRTVAMRPADHCRKCNSTNLKADRAALTRNRRITLQGVNYAGFRHRYLTCEDCGQRQAIRELIPERSTNGQA